MVPFESFGMISYQPSIVTIAVGLSLAISQIFSFSTCPPFFSREIWGHFRRRSWCGLLSLELYILLSMDGTLLMTYN